MIEQLFAFANAFALLGWLALLAAPVRRGSAVAAARWVAALLAGFYATWLIAGLVGGGEALEIEMTAAGLARLFSRPEVLLVGWAHYLAFDLWVGAWETEDAAQARVPHWLLVPCLTLTWLAGPIGLLLYLVLRAVRRN